MRLKLYIWERVLKMIVVCLFKLERKLHKALWDSGACKYVLSLESYKLIPDKYKTDLFSSNIEIKAANGTIINNNGECDITFRMGTEKFTFPFLCSDQLSQAIIIGHNFCHALNIGTLWTSPDILSFTYEGHPFQMLRSHAEPLR